MMSSRITPDRWIIQSIPRDAAKDLETRLRLALQYFSG
jgi:hypothetical protein